MAADSTSADFAALRSKYFDTLCGSLGLTNPRSESGSGYMRVSAAGENIRAYFEYERGLSWFGIGSVADGVPMCSVEDLAARFPRPRVLAEGHVRLSLAEQRAFLETNWHTLQPMFSPAHLAETRKWQQSSLEKYWEQFTGGS